MVKVICAHAGAWNTKNQEAIAAEKQAVLEAISNCDSNENILNMAMQAIEYLENHPNLDAGYGSILQMDGVARTDAAIATNDVNSKKSYAAVLQLENIKNSSKIARRLLEYGYHSVLSGTHALQFAKEEGFQIESLITEARKQSYLSQLEEFGLSEGQVPKYKDLAVNQAALDAKKLSTVGVVPADTESGLLYAISSTGGLYYGYPGRVGDSGIFGQGIYVDKNIAAVCTGEGDKIIQRMTAMRVSLYYEQTSNIQKACEMAIADLKDNQNGEGGIIAITCNGEVGIAHNTSFLATSTCRI